MNILDTFYILFRSNADEVKKASKEAQKATQELDDTLGDSSEKVDKLGKEFVKMVQKGAEAAAAVASFSAIKAGIINTAEMNSQLQIQGKLLNQNVTILRAYDAAAQATGAQPGAFGGFIQEKTKQFAAMGLPLAGAEDVVTRIRNSIKGLSRNEQLRLLDTQFGVPDQLKPLFLQSDEEFKKNIEQSKEQAKITQGAVDIARQYEAQWSRATSAMTKFWTVIDTSLLPAFTAITSAITAFFSAISDNKEASWGFFAGMIAFATAATAAIGKMTAALIGAGSAARGLTILGAVGKVSGAAGLAGAAGAAIVYGSSAAGEWIGRHLRGNRGIIDPDAMSFWMSQGYSREQAAGIVANEMRESGGKAGARGDNGLAVGLYQWHPDRVKKILAGTGIDVRTASAADQRRAAAWELDQLGLSKGLRSQQSPDTAAAFFSNRFERPANAAYESSLRASSAMSIFNGYGGNSKVTHVKIDEVNVHTQATDAHGMAAAASGELASQIRSSTSNFDDGVAY